MTRSRGNLKDESIKVREAGLAPGWVQRGAEWKVREHAAQSCINRGAANPWVISQLATIRPEAVQGCVGAIVDEFGAPLLRFARHSPGCRFSGIVRAEGGELGGRAYGRPWISRSKSWIPRLTVWPSVLDPPHFNLSEQRNSRLPPTLVLGCHLWANNQITSLSS